MKSIFFDNYDKLKAKEDWDKIIEYGLADIKSGLLSENDISLIRVRIASCYHYLGKHHEGLEQALQVTNLFKTCDDINILARGYYLVSASYRSLALSKEAQYAINNALVLIPSVSEFTKAKIYFNAGALEQDVKADHKKASEYFTKALSLFEKNSDDYNRTSIRNFRCELQNENLAIGTELKIQELYVQIKNNSKAIDSKTLVHILKLKSELFFKKARYPKSHRYANEAFIIAESKNMTGDMARIGKLINDILEKDPLAASENLWQTKSVSEFELKM